MKNKFRGRRKFFFLIPIALLFAVSAIVMLLWNAILPVVLGVKLISYWQAMGILVLSKILFGGFSGCKGKRGMHHRRHFYHKMKNMSPEERAKFKEMWKEKYSKSDFCNQK